MRRHRRPAAVAAVTLAVCGLLAGSASAATTPTPPTLTPSARPGAAAAPHLRYAMATVAPSTPTAGRDRIGSVPGSTTPYSRGSSVPLPTGRTPAAAPRPHSPKASAVLRMLAERAAAQPRKARTGRFEYQKVLGLHGTDARDLREQWIADDGSGRIRDVVQGKVTSQRFRAGGLSGPTKLPTDPKKLQALLAKSHPAYGTYEWFVAVNDVWDVQIVNPGVQSALLLMLTGKPGMVDRGMITDAVGRRGIAISTDANHSGRFRTTLVLDVRTGALLDFDQHALTATGKLSTAATADGTTAWLVEGYVRTVTQRP